MLQISRSLWNLKSTASVRPVSKSCTLNSRFSGPKLLFRGYKGEASDLKVGDVIEHKNKLVEIMKIHHNFGAQRSASMQAEFKDIRTGNKGTDKLRVSEQVEIIELDWKEIDFEGIKGNELEFSDEDGEPVMLPQSFFEGKVPWLRDGVAIKLRVFEDEPISYRWAKRYQIWQVKHTTDGDQTSHRNKPAELGNGVTIKVPIYVKTDAWVKVDVITEEFVSKEDGPDADDADD